MTKATNQTLYRIVDEYPWLEREDEYTGLTLEEAAIRMDDLTGCGAEDMILSDWDERCERCGGSGKKTHVGTVGDPVTVDCGTCDGTGKWPGPWCWTDEENGREVTMAREVA